MLKCVYGTSEDLWIPQVRPTSFHTSTLTTWQCEWCPHGRPVWSLLQNIGSRICHWFRAKPATLSVYMYVSIICYPNVVMFPWGRRWPSNIPCRLNEHVHVTSWHHVTRCQCWDCQAVVKDSRCLSMFFIFFVGEGLLWSTNLFSHFTTVNVVNSFHWFSEVLLLTKSYIVVADSCVWKRTCRN